MHARVLAAISFKIHSGDSRILKNKFSVPGLIQDFKKEGSGPGVLKQDSLEWWL